LLKKYQGLGGAECLSAGIHFYRRQSVLDAPLIRKVTVPDGVSSVATVGVTVTVKVTELLTATEADDALRANVAGIVATD